MHSCLIASLSRLCYKNIYIYPFSLYKSIILLYFIWYIIIHYSITSTVILEGAFSFGLPFCFAIRAFVTTTLSLFTFLFCCPVGFGVELDASSLFLLFAHPIVMNVKQKYCKTTCFIISIYGLFLFYTNQCVRDKTTIFSWRSCFNSFLQNVKIYIYNNIFWICAYDAVLTLYSLMCSSKNSSKKNYIKF